MYRFKLILALFFIFNMAFGQDVIFNTQAEVSAFDSSISSVEGNLTIDGDNILDISNLSSITSIGGDLNIRNNGILPNLDGLNNLVEVGGSLTISSNFSLLNIDGLQSLTTIGDFLTIDFKNLIEDLKGLSNLTSIGGGLTISRNDLLQNLDGLENINLIEGFLSINRNVTLLNIDALSNINSVGFDLSINENQSLQNLHGLESLTSVGDDLIIELNSSIQDLSGLSNLVNIEKDLWILENSSLNNLTGLEKLTALNGNLRVERNENLQNLNGLDNITSANNDIIILSNSTLFTLNGLNQLNSIQGGLRVSENDGLLNINDLANLNTIGGYLSIGTNPVLQSLNGLDNITVQGAVTISRNDIIPDLDALANLTFIGDHLSISNNHSMKNMNGLRNITSVERNVIISFNNSLTNLSGLENLTTIGGSLSVSNMPVLMNVDGLENIETIDGSLWITNNLSLRNCCGIRELLMTPDAIGGSVNINNNPMECSTQEIIIFNCDNRPTAQGCIYWDENENGIREIEERSLPQISSLVSPNNLVTYMDTAGCYTHLLENNSYILSFAPTPYWQLSSDSASYQIEVNDNHFSGLDFGFISTDPIIAGAHTSTSGIPRCNRDVLFDFNFKNEGNTVLDGRLQVQLDSFTNLSSFLHPADSIINDKIWEWHFENLYPGEVFQREAFLRLAGVERDSVNVFSSVAAQTDLHPEIFFKSNYASTILCAYDPNDKLVSPDRAGDANFTLFDETLTYTVRFQNTGNDTAFTVVVQDTLDNKLDASTLRVLGSSHQNILRTEIQEGQHLSFTFEDILLPDSTTNFDGSQGYVTYAIQSNEGLDENTLIENTASIYFDLNPPIVTNITQNTLVSCLPIDDRTVEVSIDNGENYTLPDGTLVSEAGTYITEILDEEGCPIEIIVTILDVLSGTKDFVWDKIVSLSPNPSNSHFTLSIHSNKVYDHQLKLTNLYGQVLFSKYVSESSIDIDTSHLSSGIYFIQIQSQTGQLLAVKKVIVDR